MKQRDVEQRIRTAAEHAAPDKWEDVLSACGKEQQSEANAPSSQRKNRKITYLIRGCAAAAAVVILALSVYFIAGSRMERKVDSVIMLDVNPSFNLSVNAKETILSVDALNADAETVLGGMDLRGVSLEVGINALIGSMLQHGYLDELQNSILVSVENEDASRSEHLREKVASAINSILDHDQLEGAVLSQTVSQSDQELKILSERYKISFGKAVLIRELVSQDPTLSFEDLALLSVNEIALISDSKKIAADTISKTGTVSSKAYISKEEALAAACAHAKVSAQDLTEQEIELDSEKGIMLYEVEFRSGNTEYEYDIDARTGEILKQKIKDKSQSGSGSGTSGGQDAFIGETAAKEAALRHAGYAENDVTSIRVVIEYDDGIPEYYEVEFTVGSTEYEYEIDMYTGGVLSHKTETAPSPKPPHPSLPTASPGSYIGEAAAKETAFGHANVEEASVSELKIEFEIDDDDGPVYEIEFCAGNMEYEYEIHAQTGEILKHESEAKD